MQAGCSFEAIVPIHQTVWRHIPDQNLDTHRHKQSLKARREVRNRLDGPKYKKTEIRQVKSGRKWPYSFSIYEELHGIWPHMIKHYPSHTMKPNLTYNRINSTKSPVSGACKVSEPRMMSQVKSAQSRVFLQSERWRRQYSAYAIAVIM